MNSTNALDPHSAPAKAIFDLGVVSSIIFLAIFCLVTGFIIYSLLRFAWKEGDPDPKQTAGNKKIELIWTIIPFLIVTLLFVLTARTMARVDPPAPADGKADLVVIGHQFWWEAHYPDSGVVVANEIHIPTGKPLSVRLDSIDVLHEFWVPELTRKMTAVPKRPNFLWIEADKPGIYPGLCSEFCGAQHAWMRMIVVAEEPEKFEAWQKAQLLPAPPPTTEKAIRGLKIFEEMSCVNCHTINGATKNSPNVAPNLTHIASRKQLGAGIMENTPENLRHWLQNPQAVKPGVLMPDYDLTHEQLTDLEAYFETLR